MGLIWASWNREKRKTEIFKLTRKSNKHQIIEHSKSEYKQEAKTKQTPKPVREGLKLVLKGPDLKKVPRDLGIS